MPAAAATGRAAGAMLALLSAAPVMTPLPFSREWLAAQSPAAAAALHPPARASL